MAQKKKTTKPRKKQLKQRQRQYQRQNVVVNVNTATKRRTSTSSGGKNASTISSVAPQLIQSVPLQYSPQMMLDQSSLLSEDSKNRIFQSEIRNSISLLNKETEQKTANMVSSLFELNEIKRNAGIEQEKIIEEEKQAEERKKKDEKRVRDREKRLAGAIRRNTKFGVVDTDAEEQTQARTTASQYPNQADIMRDIRKFNPLPTPRDNSITAITQRTDTGDESEITDTPIKIRIKRKPKPSPLPTPVDNFINMNNPMTPVQPDNVEEAVIAETPQRTPVRRSSLDEEFTEQPNGRWRCKTCVPFVTIADGSRSKHLGTQMHKNGGRQPAFRTP